MESVTTTSRLVRALVSQYENLMLFRPLQLNPRARWLLPMALLLSLPLLLGAAPAQVGTPCDPASACFDVTIYPASAVADLYFDGNPAAQGANSARLAGAPGTPHTIEARNFQDPGASGYGSLFIYPDLSATAQTAAGFIWRVNLYPRRQYIRGTLNVICQPIGFQSGDSVACRPNIDGVAQPDVPAGATARFILDPGPHALHTELVGDQAQNWSTTARDDSPSVVTGGFTWQVASFLLKGRFQISVFPAGLVGDIYLDDNLLAPQTNSAQVFTTPGVAHTIEVRNIVDPAANGRYRYDDQGVQAFTFANSTRFVTLRPTKVWLTGTLSVLCIVSRATPANDAWCQVSADGAPIGNVGSNGRNIFDLPTGAHDIQVAVVGGDAGRWEGPVENTLNIFGGRTSFYQARFNLLPSAPPVAPVAPPPSGGGGGGGFELGGQVAGFSRPDLMAFAGMTWVKRQVRWSPGAGADAGLINDAHAKGFRILLSVLGSPADIVGGANYGDYARFVGDLARSGADAIEVWNEMNLDREWPAGQIDPNAYTQLLRQAYQQIKANNPGTMVISGALSPTGAEGGFGLDHVWNDDRYLAGLAAAGAANYADCIGVHYNEGIISPLQDSGDPRDDYYTRYYGSMVATYYNAFGGARPLCFTELGYLTPEGYGPLPGAFGWAGNTTVAQQAQWLGQVATLARNSGIVRLIIVFNVDFTGYGDDPQGGYAMIRPGGSCPACDALRAVTGGR
jgi:hypothetical protein